MVSLNPIKSATCWLFKFLTLLPMTENRDGLRVGAYVKQSFRRRKTGVNLQSRFMTMGIPYEYFMNPDCAPILWQVGYENNGYLSF